MILTQAKIFAEPARIVRYHHTEWCEWEQNSTSELAVLSQVVFLADTVERAIDREKYILFQDDRILEEITRLSGTSFSPEIVSAFQTVAGREAFWLDCLSPSLSLYLRKNAPGGDARISQQDFLEVSEVVRKIIDFRSRFTATHSTGVSTAASLIAEYMGFSQSELDMVRFAGNLHDVGKLALSNSILEKPGRLTRQEYAFMRQHTYQTCAFLRRCGFPEYLVEWAGFHHERLDGNGYPYHVSSAGLSDGARILAVADVLTALAEDRPYRKGMDREDVLSVLKAKVQAHHLDPGGVAVLERYYDDIVVPMAHQQRLSAEQFAEEIKIVSGP